MKRFAAVLLALCAVAQLNAAELTWLTSLSNACEQAKAQKKLVLVDFTGSDWCIWCKKLDKEILSQPEFVEYAQTNIVPVKIDFPMKTEQPEELKKANKALQTKYEIKGFPTVVVLNGDGKEVGRLGYEPNGPKAFISSLEKLKGK